MIFFLSLSLIQTGVVVRAHTWDVVLDLSRPEILNNLHVQHIRLYAREECERSVRTYFWLNKNYFLWSFLVLCLTGFICLCFRTITIIFLFKWLNIHLLLVATQEQRNAAPYRKSSWRHRQNSQITRIQNFSKPSLFLLWPVKHVKVIRMFYVQRHAVSVLHVCYFHEEHNRFPAFKYGTAQKDYDFQRSG